MFRRKKDRPRPLVDQVVSGRVISKAAPLPVARGYAIVHLSPTAEGLGATGEYIVVQSEGRTVVTGCDMPEPWSIGDRTYMSYACYLEEPGSGNRVRIDMCRASDRDWVAVKRLSMSLEGYDRACVCPVAGGCVGPPVLTGEITAL